MAGKDGLVDVFQCLLRWKSDVENTEEWDEPWIDFITTTSSLEETKSDKDLHFTEAEEDFYH